MKMGKILSWIRFNEPEMLPKPRYKFPPIIFIILDDLIGQYLFRLGGLGSMVNTWVRYAKTARENF